MSNLQTAPTIAELIQLDPLTGNHLAGRPLEIRDAQVALELLRTEYKPAPKAETPTTIRTIEKSTPGERAVARDVIARLNAAADLGSLLESKGATLVRNGGDAGHYSGLSGEKHSHAIANLYLISPADNSAHMGHVVALGRRPVGRLAARNLPRGGRKEVRRWQRCSVSMSSNCAQG